MDANRFDRIVASFFTRGSRRGLLRVVAALPLPLISPLASLLDAESEAAKRRRQHRDRIQVQRKKKTKCAKAGQPTSKKRKKCCSGLSKDATGRCVQPLGGCTPATCPPGACGSLPDGCGGTLNCGACAGNSLCHGGVCQPCDVACPSGDPAICGVDLQAALDEGGTVFVCPGRYHGGFVLSVATTVIGAGQGAGAASSTILDAGGMGRVLEIKLGVGPVALERLRLTGGNLSNTGAGIGHFGTTLRMTECTVSGNTTADYSGGGIVVGTYTSMLEMLRCTIRANQATGDFASGAGIHTIGTSTLTDCLVEDNRAAGSGGGLWVNNGLTTLAGSTQVRGNVAGTSPFSGGGGIVVNGGTLVIAETCRVTENSAPATFGGGIRNFATVRLEGADPSPIVVNNCSENCVNVPKCSTTPPVSCPP